MLTQRDEIDFTGRADVDKEIVRAILKERDRCLRIIRAEPWITLYSPDGDATFRARLVYAIESGYEP